MMAFGFICQRLQPEAVQSASFGVRKMNYPESILYSVTAISCIMGAIKVFAITRKKNNLGSNPRHELRKVKDCDLLYGMVKEDIGEIKGNITTIKKEIQQIAIDIGIIKNKKG